MFLRNCIVHADDNDSNQTSRKRPFDPTSAEASAKKRRIAASERASPEPAVSGATVTDRHIPPQQDAVKPTLIRLKAVVATLKPKLRVLTSAKRTLARTFSDCSSNSTRARSTPNASSILDLSYQNNVSSVCCRLNYCG